MDEDPMRVSILTFEPPSPPDTESIRSELAAEGIEWHSLPYHKSPSVIATGWDILRGLSSSVVLSTELGRTFCTGACTFQP
jgi:hypothetical protein